MSALFHARTLAALVLLAGCATATGAGVSGGAGGGDGGVVPTYDACSTGMPCSPGKTCVNGICAKG